MGLSINPKGNGKIVIESYEQEIIGVLDSNNIKITDILLYNEGSFDYYLDKILEQSTGYLDIILIYEGGDSIEELISDNGVVKRSRIL